jgi:hypothetical protein
MLCLLAWQARRPWSNALVQDASARPNAQNVAGAERGAGSKEVDHEIAASLRNFANARRLPKSQPIPSRTRYAGSGIS